MKSEMKKKSLKYVFELPVLVAILALACPPIVQAQQSKSATLDGNAIEYIDQLQDLSEKDDATVNYELTEEVETAIDPLAFAIQKNLIEDTDDLVSRPYDYQGRQVVVIGSVVQFFWEYRLKSETGQNKIVIDVDGLKQSDRAKLDAAIGRAGFFGRVRARIHGSITRQTATTFELAATELVLIEPTDATEMLVPTRSALRRRESGDREVASSNGGTAGGGGSGSSDSGGGNSGSSDSGSSDSGGGGGDKGGGDKGGGRGKGKK
jgi:hypothetical protein